MEKEEMTAVDVILSIESSSETVFTGGHLKINDHPHRRQIHDERDELLLTQPVTLQQYGRVVATVSNKSNTIETLSIGYECVAMTQKEEPAEREREISNQFPTRCSRRSDDS